MVSRQRRGGRCVERGGPVQVPAGTEPIEDRRCSSSNTPSLTQGVNRLCAIGALPPNDGGRCRQAQPLVNTQTIAVNHGEMYRSFAAAGTSGFDFTGDQHQIDISGLLRAFGHRLQFRSAGHLDHKSRVLIRDGAREGDRLPQLKLTEGEAGRSPRVDLGPVSRPPDAHSRRLRTPVAPSTAPTTPRIASAHTAGDLWCRRALAQWSVWPVELSLVAKCGEKPGDTERARPPTPSPVSKTGCQRSTLPRFEGVRCLAMCQPG